MPENEEHQGGPENQPPTPEEIRTREVDTVAKKLLSEKAAASKLVDEADRTKADKALVFFDRLQNDPEPDFDVGGSNLKMPAFSVDKYSFKNNEASIAGFHKTTGEGLLLCSVNDSDGDVIVGDDGKPVLFEFPRDEVLNAQVHSEKTVLRDAFSDDEQTLFNTYAESLPQNDHPVPPAEGASDLVDSIAEKQGILRTADLQDFIDQLPDEKKTPEVQDAIDALQDRKLATAADFRTIVEAAGYDDDTLGDELGADIAAQRAQHETDLAALAEPDGADVATRDELNAKIAEADQKLALVDKAKDAMAETKVPDVPERELDGEAVDNVTKEIRAQIASLEGILETYYHKLENGDVVLKENLTKAEANTMRQAERLRAEFALAEKATGILGPLRRLQVLTDAKETYDKELKGFATPQGIEKLLKDPDLLAGVAIAQTELQATLGLTDAEMKAAGEEEGGWEKLMEDDKYADKEDELNEKTFGDIDKTELYQMIDEVKQSHLDIKDARWNSRLREFAFRNKGKRLGILALLLAAIPVAAAAMTVAVTVGAVGAAGKGMQQH